MPLQWSDGDFISSYKLNTSTYHRMTGLEMEALSSTETVNGMIVFCTQTSSVFTAGNTYSRSLDNNSWETFDIASPQDAVDDLIGGMGTVHTVDMMTLTPDMFNPFVASGGTITSDIAGITSGGLNIQTGTTVGGNATADLFGIALSYVQESAFQVGMRNYSNTNFTRLRVGIEAERSTEANLSARKYGIEGCSSSGVNWLVFSSEGTTRSTLSTATPVAPGAHTSYRVTKNVGASITLRVSASDVATKTTNVPTTGATLNRIFRAGIQNTAAENKQLNLTGLRIYGTVDDVRWQ